MVLERARQPRVERFALEVGEARQLGATRRVPEAHRAAALDALLAREHPREAVERALGQVRVGLEASHERRDDRRLRRAVRPVQEDDLVDASGADEVPEHAVDGRLDLLLACHARGAPLGREVEVEDAEAPLLPPRRVDLGGAEVVDRLPQVLRGPAGVRARRAAEQLQVLLEREDAPLLDEGRLHAVADRSQVTPGVHVLNSRTPGRPLAKASGRLLPRRSVS